MINLSETAMALPMPRSGNVRRNTSDLAGMKSDILNAGREAQKKYDSGQYSKAEYEAEMQTLNRWRKLTEGKK
jgi:hypothetical protein